MLNTRCELFGERSRALDRRQTIVDAPDDRARACQGGDSVKECAQLEQALRDKTRLS